MGYYISSGSVLSGRGKDITYRYVRPETKINPK